MSSHLHQTLIDSRTLLHYSFAGAGIEVLRRMWRTPGSSQYIAGGAMLQARSELIDFIGHSPEASYVSREVALEMAMASFRKAVIAAAVDSNFSAPAGISVSAAIASNRMPRGEQRAHIALVTTDGIWHRKLLLKKSTGELARQEHDEIIADAIESLLMSDPDESIVEDSATAALDLIRMRPVFLPDGRRIQSNPSRRIYFPANFNPIHEGHRAACREAERQLGSKVCFMLEACPPNKSEIPVSEILRRVALLRLERQIDRGRAVEITWNQGNYLDKARAHPGSTFVAGADAIQRILEPGWGYDVKSMLDELSRLDTLFLVMGRRIDGDFVTVEQLPIPDSHRNMFRHLDGAEDISSSELRERTNEAP